MAEQPPQWPHNQEQGTEHNPFWRPSPQQSYKQRFEYEGPRHWHEVFRDFLTMRSEEDCAYLINEPTADYGHAYGWFVMVSGAIVVLFIAILAILPSDTFENTTTSPSPTFGNTRTTQQQQITTDDILGFYCVSGPVGIVLNIVVYTIGLGVVHVAATSLFNASGDFEKLVYGVFTLLTSYYAVSLLFAVPMVILWGVIFAASGPSLIFYCLMFAMIIVIIYIYYLYTMIVKTVYNFGWGEAFMSAIVIPIGCTILLYCGCAFCFASSTAS